MRETPWMYYVFLMLTSAVIIKAYSETIEKAADKLVEKRKLHKDGFDDIKVAKYSLERVSHDGKSSGHTIRRRDLSNKGDPVKLRLQKEDGEETVLILEHKPSVLNKQATIRLRQRQFTEDLQIKKQDCFLVGHVEDNPLYVASFSFCNNMKGVFNGEKKTFWVETLDADDDPTEQHIVVASKNITELKNDGINKDIYEKVNRTINRNDGKQRSRAKRNTPTITVETAIVLDELYIQELAAASHGYDGMVEAILMKWGGVQAEWARVDVLGYIVIIDIKTIELWDPNPYWYTPDPDLDVTLNLLCYGVNVLSILLDFDHIHFYTGLTGTDVAGKAVQGKICIQESNCAVSTATGRTEIRVSAHELGHQFNMLHDQDLTGCVPVGIMGSVTYGWSSCSINSFQAKMSESAANIGCLTQTNIATDGYSYTAGWPAFIYTDDEICQLKSGADYRFRTYPYSAWGECTLHSCINMNTASSEYGVMEAFAVPTGGHYCGEGMVCTTYYSGSSYECLSHADTGLPASLINVQTGGWSAWGSLSSCSRTCGTGVQYRQRRCDNPKPLLTAGCEGSEYDATLCNTTPCGTDVDATIKTQRASETCASMKTNGLYESFGLSSADYELTGSRFYSQIHGQCEVKCDPVAGVTVPTNQRFGLMPDGTPCTLDSLSTFVETNNLPRISGKFSKCLQGYCEAFNCQNTNADLSYDGCGVCGGSGSTCTVVDQVYSTAVAAGERVVMATVPVDAFMIQAWFEYSGMNDFYIELYDSSDNAIIATKVPGDSAITGNNLNSPKAFAGTDWYYHSTQQYLWAAGPTDQEVVLKLYNFGSNSNQGVSYAYSTPSTAGTASTTTSTTTTSAGTTTTTTSTTTTTVSTASPAATTTTPTVSTATTTSASTTTQNQTDSGAAQQWSSVTPVFLTLTTCVHSVSYIYYWL